MYIAGWHWEGFQSVTMEAERRIELAPDWLRVVYIRKRERTAMEITSVPINDQLSFLQTKVKSPERKDCDL